MNELRLRRQGVSCPLLLAFGSSVLYLMGLVPYGAGAQNSAAQAQAQAYAAYSAAAKLYAAHESPTPPAYSLSQIQDKLIEFPLPKGEGVYGSIDGRKMHKYVVALADIAIRYRDSGHPKYWGRIKGTEANRWTSEWLAAQFSKVGLSDVRIQPLPLPPMWTPESWDVTVTLGDKTIELPSAQPSYNDNALPPGGVNVDAVYLGLGTDVDFAGKDLKGKAVFIYSQWDAVPDRSCSRAARRAGEMGAAVIFCASMIPGNMHLISYPSGTEAPMFSLGNDDGVAVREMLAAAKTDGHPLKVKASLRVASVPHLSTSLVWATLPGATDETIYIVAHEDGWFEAAYDNASGVAMMLGLAEYFAKRPQAERRRTLVFIGLDGHHNLANAEVGLQWIAKHQATLFANTALIINSEHPAAIELTERPAFEPFNDQVWWSNGLMPETWNFGGTRTNPDANPVLRRLGWDAFQKFGLPLALDPRSPISDMSEFSGCEPVMEVINAHDYFHTDWDTPEVVPWTGLEAAARATAYLIDEVNRVPLSTLRAPYAHAMCTPHF